jgi:hypothetical protein
MGGFQAIILICVIAVPPDQCNEDTAADVLSVHVASELGCVTGWEDVLARSSLYSDVGTTAYVRTLCRRSRDAD